MKYNLLGYDDGYESVTEYYIINKYLGENTDYKEIIKVLYEINNTLIHLTHKDVVLCQFYTLIKKKKEFLKINRVNQIMENIKNFYILVIFSLKNQYYYFGKGSILTYNNYKKQREEIKTKFKLLNKYIEEFIKKEFGKKDSKYIILKDILSKTYNIFDKLLSDTNNSDEINISSDKYLELYDIFYK
jgi:hypothetical protein